MSISASEARRRLFPLIEEVNDNAEAVEIVSKAGSAYLVPAAEYEAWKTTMHLFAAPANARHLLESYKEAVAGHAQPRELVDPDEVETPVVPTEGTLVRMDRSEAEKLGVTLVDVSDLASHASYVSRTALAAWTHGDALVRIVPVGPDELPEAPESLVDLLIVDVHDSGARQ